MADWLAKLKDIEELKKSGLLSEKDAQDCKDKVLREDVRGLQGNIEEEVVEEIDEEIEMVPNRDPSGRNGEEIHSILLKQVETFKKENSHIQTKVHGNQGSVFFMEIWNENAQWKRLILENHSMDYRTKHGILTTITIDSSRKKGEPNPGDWIGELGWEKWGRSSSRTFFDPEGHPLEEVQEILKKLL
mgnify:CR=1 FL=1